MNKISSFIDTVITKCTSTKTKNGTIACMVQNQDGRHVANRIAMTYVDLTKERNRRRLEAKRLGNPIDPMDIKPEHMLSFVQSMMNNCCWAAHTVIRAARTEDQATGIDFTIPIAEQAGLQDSHSMHNCSDTLMDDWAIMNELHTWLCGQMNYMTDLEQLYLYAEKAEIEPGHWEYIHQLMDFEDVLPLLDEKLIELATQKEDQLAEYAQRYEFGSAYAA